MHEIVARFIRHELLSGLSPIQGYCEMCIERFEDLDLDLNSPSCSGESRVGEVVVVVAVMTAAAAVPFGASAWCETLVTHRLTPPHHRPPPSRRRRRKRH
jgi:hypothetical protein